MCQWFAPTSLVVSFETEGRGKLSEQDIERIVERDAAGQVVALRLPLKAVLISNHQVCMRQDLSPVSLIDHYV